jgi:uncharacterized RDD family membrane protein YckC
MFCSKCGANVADGAAFCGACGQQAGGIAAPPVAAAIPAGYVARPTVAYAGFWLRFVAFIIDVIILGIVGSIITFPFVASMGAGMFFHGRPPMTPEEWMPFFVGLWRVVLIRVVLNWLYYAFLESSAWQGTIGKKALGLEVTDLAGQRITFARASGRFFAKIISSIILLIGYIMAGFTEKKQALHDMIAGCLVIRRL